MVSARGASRVIRSWVLLTLRNIALKFLSAGVRSSFESVVWYFSIRWIARNTLPLARRLTERRIRMQAGTHVLGSRYELVRHIVADEVSEAWTGVDEYQTEYLVKVWPFRGDSPDSFEIWKHAINYG